MVEYGENFVHLKSILSGAFLGSGQISFQIQS
jgi:hypothetical protein